MTTDDRKPAPPQGERPPAEDRSEPPPGYEVGYVSCSPETQPYQVMLPELAGDSRGQAIAACWQHHGEGAPYRERAEQAERERDDAREDARAWSAIAVKMERERDEAHRLLGRATAYLKSYGIGGKPTEGARTLLIAIEATLKGQNT